MEYCPWAELLTNCNEHLICYACLSELSERALKNRLVLDPVNGLECCGNSLDISSLPSDKKTRLIQFTKVRFMEKYPNKMYCPGCNDIIEIDNPDWITCKKCSHEICSKCRQSWHPGNECSSAHEKCLLDNAKKLNLSRCKCGQFYERIRGCNHMTCEICNYEFCHICNGPYTPNDPDGCHTNICRLERESKE